MRWLVVVAIAGCAAPVGGPVPPAMSAQRSTGPVVAVPGEVMEYEIRLRGVAIGSLQVAVGRPGWVGGRAAVIVRSRGSSGGLLALFTKLTWELTTTLDLGRGLPIEATGESTVTFDGKTEHERISEHWSADDTHHDMHSLGATLRGWHLPAGVKAALWFWLGGGHFQAVVWEAGRDYVAAAHARAVRYEGVVEEEYRFAVWVSDDALRVPVAVDANTKFGKVSAVLVDYEPGVSSER